MPEVVLNKIMNESDLKSILILRKVCHSLRTFVHTHHSGPNLIDLNIYIKPNEIEAWYYTRNGLYVVHYRGRNQVNNCVLVHENKEKVLRDMNFVDAFLLDLEIFISLQNSVMRQFRVTRGNADPFQTVKDVNLSLFNRILKALENVLKKRPRPLQTNEIYLGVEDQEQVLLILKSMDAKVLKNLSIYSNLKEEEELEINEIIQMDHWKQAKSLMVEDFILDVPVECLIQFSFVRAVLKTISTKDLMVLKKNILQSSIFKEFSLTYTQLKDESEISSVLGEPIITTDIFGRQDFKWIIDSPVNCQKVEITHFQTHRQFKITNIELLEDKVKRMIQERS
ncbi:hypothetical protein CRE_18749 [Caenorhabditis remanei]|uniref:F-box domain-containing protein n=1 Tax=Caenorhabditis remanei TaxID=31234 RepID=E3LJS1_CAERE|nr:hypothetical protein CRE_18749 [Caenorhabditis remanei]